MIKIFMYKSYCYLIFLFLFTNCGQNKIVENNKQKSSKSLSINEVTIHQSINANFPLQLQANAIVKAQNQSQLFFKAMGEIEQINVSNNTMVKVGQILAILDQRQTKVAIQIAKDQINKANFAINKLVLEYGGKDGDTTSIKPRFLENMKLQSGFYEAQTALHTAQLQYNNTFLRAPYSGIIANLKTKANNQASVAEPFCTLISNSRMAAEGFILESELGVVQIGHTAKIQPLAYVDKTYL